MRLFEIALIKEYETIHHNYSVNFKSQLIDTTAQSLLK